MKTSQLVLVLVAVIIVTGGAYYFFIRVMPRVSHGSSASSTIQTNTDNTSTTTSVPDTSILGMSEYTDSTYGFTFWYPSILQISASTTDDTTDFPGGTETETLQVGAPGGVVIHVVNSPTGTITDEPSNHASPIAQTKYFYDTTGQLMVAYPQGAETGGSIATTTANISKTTISGLPLLASGLRFDATIIPLSGTRFLVINDGGGSSFTPDLAGTVAAVGAAINSSTQMIAVQAEKTAYNSSQ